MSQQFELGAQSRRSPIAAAILGLLAPGLGLLYCGRLRPAFIALAAGILPWLFCALTSNAALKVGLVLFYFAAYLVQLVYGVVVAIRIGENYQLQRFNRGLVYILVFMLFAAYNELDSTYFTQMVPLSTESMIPTLAPDDVVLLSRAAYSLGDPQIGDVVAYLHDPRSQAPFLGRVIAVPGDRVELSDGRYSVNGESVLAQTAIQAKSGLTVAANWNQIPLTKLADDQYFIVADNQVAGYDSRLCGPVPRDQFIGRIDAILLTGPGENSRWGKQP